MSTDAQHKPLSEADKLRQDAASAAQVRALTNHPDVIALRTEKVRTQVDAAIWIGIFLGLAFTMVNVQTFAAAGAAPWSLPWLSAWLLDPMVSLVLVAVLRAEQVTARYQVGTGVWAHRTKWFAFLATYVMNTWKSWVALDVAGVVLHSVPPVLVFLAAETAPVLRDRLTEAVIRAGQAAHGSTPEVMPASSPAPADHPVAGAAEAAVTVPVPTAPEPAPAEQDKPVRRTPAKRKAPAKRKTSGRKLSADYVNEARAAWAPGIEITPAWIREVTDCGRGTSSTVAAQLRDQIQAETATTVTTTPAPDTTDDVTGPAGLSERAAA
ncbi:hypothetical protein [Amycolatopsis sp. YIM 10]|uniref:hypothetical protein n=1 Tax=Amycolatopsis sp. YIM 10 TaxID=2653857 RepID=UPI0012A92615|nr:hypothetical protein [Amycolatopsis sp. YIM 10]QFU85722.1 hypothetical protein YIM_02485 [Amycolatopsis sp. YIM 10]